MLLQLCTNKENAKQEKNYNFIRQIACEYLKCWMYVCKASIKSATTEMNPKGQIPIIRLLAPCYMSFFSVYFYFSLRDFSLSRFAYRKRIRIDRHRFSLFIHWLGGYILHESLNQQIHIYYSIIIIGQCLFVIHFHIARYPCYFYLRRHRFLFFFADKGLWMEDKTQTI